MKFSVCMGLCGSTMGFLVYTAWRLPLVSNQMIAKKVDYSDINHIREFRLEDINNDGLEDIILYLKNGEELRYIHNGYELQN